MEKWVYQKWKGQQFFWFLCVLFILSSAACNRQKPVNVKKVPGIQVVGETIAMEREKPSFLLKSDALIERVYKVGVNGITEYKAGQDYVVINGGGIKRTSKSSIPDFALHKVIFDKGSRFSFKPEPGRNPQLSVPFQVMVDYATKKDSVIRPADKSTSQNIKRIISSGDPISIYCIGTSITAGAHTIPNYYKQGDQSAYPYLVAKAINKLYGNYVNVFNLSVGGASTYLFIRNLNFLIAHRPDIVFIEFGMNEHSAGMNTDSIINVLENGIIKLKSNGINCVLVGFFQQNPYWELEDTAQTILFNNKLRRIASRQDVYFADIYKQFSNLPKEKLYRDLTGDYLHHPTDFGHKLYYLSIAPYVLFKNKKESELLNLINEE